MMDGMNWGMGWGMGLGWLFWIVIIGLIIWGLKAFTDNQRNRDVSGPPTGESALDVLKKRYARGEIGDDEYERMRRQLQQ